MKMLASRSYFEPPAPQPTGGGETPVVEEASASNLLIVGSHPPRPQPQIAMVLPYYIPVTAFPPFESGRHRRSRLETPRVPFALEGFGRFINDGSRRFINNGIPELHVTRGFAQPGPLRRRLA
jgi:hypothetical protein